MDNFKAQRDETIESFINKYPLTVPYFQERNLSDRGLETTLGEFCETNELNWNDLDRQLREHLARAVIPESDNCFTLCTSNNLCGKKMIAGIMLVILFTGSISWFIFA